MLSDQTFIDNVIKHCVEVAESDRFTNTRATVQQNGERLNVSEFKCLVGCRQSVGVFWLDHQTSILYRIALKVSIA